MSNHLGYVMPKRTMSITICTCGTCTEFQNLLIKIVLTMFLFTELHDVIVQFVIEKIKTRGNDNCLVRHLHVNI